MRRRFRAIPVLACFIDWMAQSSCRHGRVRPFGNVTPFMAVDGSGRFVRHEKLPDRFPDVFEVVRADTEGQLLADGAVGTFRLRETIENKRTPRVLDRCATGVLHWTAVP